MMSLTLVHSCHGKLWLLLIVKISSAGLRIPRVGFSGQLVAAGIGFCAVLADILPQEVEEVARSVCLA